MTVITITSVVLILMWPVESLAYVGPGMGAGVIATAIGFVVAICVGLFAFIYYPIKRIIKKKKKGKPQTANDESKRGEED